MGILSNDFLHINRTDIPDVSDDLPDKSLTAILLEGLTRAGPIESRRDLLKALAVTLAPFAIMALTFWTALQTFSRKWPVEALLVPAAAGTVFCLGLMFGLPLWSRFTGE